MISKSKVIEAKNKIKSPDNWTQGAYARNENNIPTTDDFSLSFDNACKFCMLGAFHSIGVAEFEIFALWHKIGRDGSISYFNDHCQTTHEDVMKIFDKMIEVAE